MRSIALALVTLLIVCGTARAAALTFNVSIDPAARSTPASGRLVVYLIRTGTSVSPMHQPTDGFIEEDPQPIFGTDVSNLKPGDAATLDDSATSFPVPTSRLPAGHYRAQAVLDMSHENSQWRREPGNLFSDTVQFEVKADGVDAPVAIRLTRVVPEPTYPKVNDVQIVRIRSKLLSDFRGRDVFLQAGISFPVDYDPKRVYPAVYEVPGFGGDHTMAFGKSDRRLRRPAGSPAEQVARNCFWIMLDPEGPNGHTLFADSDNNGPCGRALVEELIPAIEAKFKLIAQPSARLVTGHSSGGWSSLWLALTYPETFGACWSSSPDPIDFRRFEHVNIYGADSMYTGGAGRDTPSARFEGKETMTVRQENGMENVLGPRNDSAQQWDSWQAVFGHRQADGLIQPLFDPSTGKIDRAEADSYRRFDITDRLRKDPQRYVPIFRERIRLLVGSADNYYLNEAVELLKTDLDQLDPPKPDDARLGYVKIIPDLDHNTIGPSRERQAWAQEMMDHLRRAGHVPAATQPR